MRWVASAAGATPLGPADRATLEAAYRYVFKGTEALNVDDLPPTTPAELATALSEPTLAEHAIRFLAVMALVDGRLDERKITLVLGYAAALRIDDDYLHQLAEAGLGHLQWVAMDMMRQNIRSIAGLVWNPDNVIGTFLPYSGTRSDVDLARRYQGLGELPPGTFGRAFWAHYQRNGYAFPGEKNGLNEKFATPHDSTHVLSGYDTSPHGELLVSTFTAATGAFDPEAFWLAWDRGSEINVDTFGPSWEFWTVIYAELAELRKRYAVPPLDPSADATLALLSA